MEEDKMNKRTADLRYHSEENFKEKQLRFKI